MTVITKPFVGEKKGEIVGFANVENGQSAPPVDIEGEHTDRLFLIQPRPRRFSSASTLFLFLAALCVLLMGILGGIAVYRAYARSQAQRMHFHGFCGVPYDSQPVDDNNLLLLMNNRFREMQELTDQLEDDLFKPMAEELQRIENETNSKVDDQIFTQAFDLDLSDEQRYAKIDVPDFRDGRTGRFLHDFKKNQSGIIDQASKRCFVMPLDRDTVLPPQSMADLVNKIWSGYYNIDTTVIRKKMRVVTPAVTDMSTISPRIADECAHMKIYMLEKFVSGVSKRSVPSDSMSYTSFTGNYVNYEIEGAKNLD